VAEWGPDDVVVLDEMGANVGLTPTHARAPRNERAHDRAPYTKGTNHTTLAVLTTGGLAAAMTVRGAADARTVEAFVRELVVPLLRPGQVLVLDNVATHKGAALRRLVEGAGCRLRFLPAYSPDPSPIEEAFAQLKARLRRAKARTAEALEAAIGDALDAVTPRDARHYFAHCGYGTAK
jgi:transposase